MGRDQSRGPFPFPNAAIRGRTSPLSNLYRCVAFSMGVISSCLRNPWWIRPNPSSYSFDSEMLCEDACRRSCVDVTFQQIEILLDRPHNIITDGRIIPKSDQ
jgi:hypothetical protein